MLKNIYFAKKPQEEECRTRLKAARERLAGLQTKIKEHKIPVLVLMEGWGTAGKGSIISQMIQNIDPRFFKVAAMDSPTPEERRKPFLYRFFAQIPEAGKFTFLDSGWMDEITGMRMRGKMDQETYELRLDSVRRFERQLTDNGYLVMKFFCHISQKQQRKRIEALVSDIDTRWRVNDNDLWQNRHYEKCLEVFDRFLDDTNTPSAPWYIIDAKSKKWAELQAMEERKYKEELARLQRELGELHNRLYRKKVPVVIVYEGQDAAGKGGNIKRITQALDPRGFEVHPIASPEPHEKARHYLWRFWTRLPKTGHIAIFDRSWYGRVMVERLEGFCSENDWKRAYNEINEFEKELYGFGAVIIKFWVQIDKDTQLERFTDRQNTPGKQWKITDEDWRNREKWDDYETAVDEMLQKTSTVYAPWHILESVDKKYARIKALEIVARELERALE